VDPAKPDRASRGVAARSTRRTRAPASPRAACGGCAGGSGPRAPDRGVRTRDSQRAPRGPRSTSCHRQAPACLWLPRSDARDPLESSSARLGSARARTLPPGCVPARARTSHCATRAALASPSTSHDTETAPRGRHAADVHFADSLRACGPLLRAVRPSAADRGVRVRAVAAAREQQDRGMCRRRCVRDSNCAMFAEESAGRTTRMSVSVGGRRNRGADRVLTHHLIRAVCGKERASEETFASSLSLERGPGGGAPGRASLLGVEAHELRAKVFDLLRAQVVVHEDQLADLIAPQAEFSPTVRRTDAQRNTLRDRESDPRAGSCEPPCR
jgi:hypothetical protein